MKRIQESRLGREPHLVIESPETYPASTYGDLRMSDVMSTHIVCVLDSTTVEQLAGVFNKRKIMAAPIVHYQSKSYLGMISMSDIFSFSFSQKILLTHRDGILVQDDGMGILNQPMRDFINSHALVEVAPDCTVQRACDLMLEKHLHHVVVTRNHKVKGIFSSFDAMRILATQTQIKLDSDQSKTQ